MRERRRDAERKWGGKFNEGGEGMEMGELWRWGM